MSVFILKFGGSTLGKESDVMSALPKIAANIKQYVDKGHQVVVVVSAFSGETRELRDTYQSFGIEPNTCYADYILAMGEQKSSVVLTNYLNNAAKIPAASLVGAKLPIFTDNNHGDAKIIDIDTNAVKSCLNRGLVTVIPGFIGLTLEGETTTLGLDGSDTTAAFVAGYLGVDECRLYKDVSGVFTANPRRVPSAKIMSEIDTESMLTFSELGARILHPRALEAAIKYDMTIRVLPSFADSKGTVISKNTKKKKIVGITYWQHEKDLITISVIGEIENKKIVEALKQNNIKAREFKTEFDKTSSTVLLDNPDDLNQALQILHTLAGLDDETAALKAAQMNFFDPGLINIRRKK
ncbi:MAG: hypothetical protein LBR70_02070 [Lactobacillaceae bacterium]|jgi:aspartate kinase|nr:hypothetical protein [Lactobacillaceae bacterium]